MFTTGRAQCVDGQPCVRVYAVGIVLYSAVNTVWPVLLLGIPNLIKRHSQRCGEGTECVGGLAHGLRTSLPESYLPGQPFLL